MFDLDLRPIFILAVIGLISSILGLVIGGGWLVMFIIDHVRII